MKASLKNISDVIELADIESWYIDDDEVGKLARSFLERGARVGLEVALRSLEVELERRGLPDKVTQMRGPSH